MSLNPILTGGGASNQSIYEEVTTARHPIGTRAQTPDGRVFRYASNRGTALAAGVVLKAAEISAHMDDIDTNTAVVGDTKVNVTPASAVTFAKDELAGGFLSINSGTTGAGMQYRITGNPARAATADAFDVDIDGEIKVAFNADTTATVVPNLWSEAVIADADETHFASGVTPIAVTAGSDSAPYYFWCQTWGVATVLADAASIAIGQSVQTGAGTAGAFEAAAESSGTLNQIIGVNLFTTVDADFMPVFLTIAP